MTPEKLTDVELTKQLVQLTEEVLARGLLAPSYERLAASIANNAFKNAALRAAGVQA